MSVNVIEQAPPVVLIDNNPVDPKKGTLVNSNVPSPPVAILFTISVEE